MKKIILKLLTLIISVVLMFSFSACNQGVDDNPDSDYFPEDDEPLEGLVLIRKNVANFKVVTASGAGSAAIRAAGDFVSQLRDLGIEIDDVVSDKDADNVTECEIIIGTGAKNRPSACQVSTLELGEEGYVIKVVDQRVVIAGGTTNLTKQTLAKFIEEYLGIDETAESKRNAAVASDLNVFVPTEYRIDSIKIAGNDISDYVIACDQNDLCVYPFIVDAFKDTIALNSGIRLDIADVKNVSSSQKKILFRTVDDAGEDGFRISVSGNDLVIECAYPALFSETFDDFVMSNIKSKRGNISFASDFTYTTHISTVRYADFGAVGDGKTNDFFAIRNAHIRVNETKQTLIPEGKNGNEFYIGKTWSEETEGIGQVIPITTDVNFDTAKFIIDDTVADIHDSVKRGKHIFNIERDYNTVIYKSAEGYVRQISSLTDNPTLGLTTTEIPWLKEVLTELGHDKYMVTFINEGHRDYIRFGGNENDGNLRRDFVIVDKNGKLASDTPIIFEFTDITEIQITPVTDTPITVEGGIFKTICARCAAGVDVPDYDAYARGIQVQRANTTIKNIDHEVLNEPTDKGYPYSGFIAFSGTYNSTLTDSKLSGRQLYYGGKEASSSLVPMGSYDLTMNYSSNVSFKNITQYRDIKDQKYWGISAANGCKNMLYDNVVISRIDAHCGFWNVDIKNSTIGFAINVIGGGILNIENTVKKTGDSFIYLRDDYGATFNGTINIKNCSFDGYKSWSSGSGSFPGTRYTSVSLIKSGFNAERTFNHATEGTKYYKNWDFGYTCYMPQYVNIDKFTCGTSYTVYNDIVDAAFNSSLPHGGYQITKKITYKNMSKPTICPSSGCTKLRAVSLVAG